MRASRFDALATSILLIALSACAQKLTPQQEYAYNAVDTCAKEHGNVGWTYWVTPEGGIRFRR